MGQVENKKDMSTIRHNPNGCQELRVGCLVNLDPRLDIEIKRVKMVVMLISGICLISILEIIDKIKFS